MFHLALDVKRSSHKKVSVFLDAMASSHCDHPPLLGLQCTNGVASVVAVQRAHDLLRGRGPVKYPSQKPQSNTPVKNPSQIPQLNIPVKYSIVLYVLIYLTSPRVP